MQKSEYLLIFILANQGGFFIMTGFDKSIYFFRVWGIVITAISILCCIGCCLIQFKRWYNSKEEENGRVFNENPQLNQVVITKKGNPYKWNGRKARAPSEFGRPVKPIRTRGADFAPHTTASPPPSPGFKNISTPLAEVQSSQIQRSIQHTHTSGV